MSESVYEEWRRLAVGSTGGGDASFDSLKRITPAGLEVEPLYREARRPPLHPRVRPMQLVLDYSHWDIDVVEQQMRAELAGLQGGNAVAWIFLDRATRIGATHTEVDAVHVGRGGTVIADASELGRLCRVAHELEVPAFFDAGANALPIEALGRAATRDLPVAEGFFEVTIDPLGAWARDGMLPASLYGLYEEGGTSPISVSVLPYHRAGCDPVQEVGFAVASAIDQLRGLHDACRDDQPSFALRFHLGVTPDVVTEIAKLRAVRLIWSKLGAELGSPVARIHATGSLRTHSIREPWVNQLRNTASALAADIGGADSFCPRAFDTITGEPSPRGRRIARNTPLMLAAEAHVGRVADPAGGAGVIEDLTERIARGAWELVREIERREGMTSALASGWVHTEIDGAWAELCDRYDRAGVLVGVNEYRSDDHELDLERDAPEMERIAARFGELREDLEIRGADEAFELAEEGATIDDLNVGMVRGVAAAIEPMPVRRIAADLGWEGPNPSRGATSS